MRRKIIALMLAVTLGLTLGAVADSVDVFASKTSSYRPPASGGWPRGWYGNYFGNIRVSRSDSSYFYADISGIAVQAGQEIQITSVTLNFYINTMMETSYPLTLANTAYRISEDWQEGYTVNDDQGTWDLVTLPPAYAEAYGSDILVDSDQAGAMGWRSIDVTDLAIAWQDGTYPNYGVVVKSSGDWSLQQLSSRQNGTYAPYFHVEYTTTASSYPLLNIAVTKDSCYDWRGWFSAYEGTHIYVDRYAKSYFYSNVADRLKDPGHTTTVRRATLNYYVYGSRFGNGGIDLPYTAQAFRISEDYSDLWSEGPAITDDPATRDLVTVPPAHAEGYGSFTTTTETGWMTLDVTDLVQAWVDGDYPQDGVMVTHKDGYLPQGIYGHENGDPSVRPFFLVEYEIERPQWENEVTLGHRVLINRGLQIQTEAFSDYSAPPGVTIERFNESNFTSLNMWTDHMDPSWAGDAPGPLWSRYYYADWPGTELLQEREIPYLPNMISYQCEDDNVELDDYYWVQDIKNWFTSRRAMYPNVIFYTDESPQRWTYNTVQSYIMTAKPDMVMFNQYPFDGDVTGGSPTSWYTHLQKYRQLGLDGIDGNGNQPIPSAVYTQSWDSGHIVSESEMRLNEFGAWAFGYKLVCAFVFNQPPTWWNMDSIFFVGAGCDTPTAKFYEMQETNRQSNNLGPVLVRLISTDVRMVMGRHPVELLGVIVGSSENDHPSDVTIGIAGADDYMTGVSASNLGSKNNGEDGDVIIGFFKPLHESFDGDDYSDQAYFMVVNGLSDATGNVSETQQSIHLTFNMGTSGITSLQRISRDTGLVENVPLVSDGGSLYHVDITLDGGTGDLFKYNTGAPVVGIAEVVLMPGDANGDGMVDVGDLGILAANYGGTGKTWAQGDFNDDGLVDVGDLGILAANYGSGTSGADFDADYAKVFESAADESGASDEASTLCSTLGLPLVAGFLMVGLLLVKLED